MSTTEHEAHWGLRIHPLHGGVDRLRLPVPENLPYEESVLTPKMIAEMNRCRWGVPVTDLGQNMTEMGYPHTWVRVSPNGEGKILGGDGVWREIGLNHMWFYWQKFLRYAPPYEPEDVESFMRELKQIGVFRSLDMRHPATPVVELRWAGGIPGWPDEVEGPVVVNGYVRPVDARWAMLGVDEYGLRKRKFG